MLPWLLASLALVVVIAWFASRRRRPAPTMTAPTMTAPVPAPITPPAPAPPSRWSPEEQALGRALSEACRRAVEAWFDALSTCPACDAVVSPATPVPLDGPPVPLASAEIAERRVDGPLAKTLVHPRGFAVLGPAGARVVNRWHREIRCLACGWTSQHGDSDDGSPREVAPLAPEPQAGPRLRWDVTAGAGTRLGSVCTGGGLATGVEVAPGVDGPGRALLRIVTTIIEAVIQRDRTGVEASRALELAHDVIAHHARGFAATVQSPR